MDCSKLALHTKISALQNLRVEYLPFHPGDFATPCPAEFGRC